MSTTTAQLTWDACYNTRDLGGLPTAGGGQTHTGVVVRSDILARLTPAGVQAIIGYGVRAIIDLRSPDEVAQEPYTLPQPTGGGSLPVYYNLPFVDRSQLDPAIFAQAHDLTAEYCLMLDHCMPQVAAIVEQIAGLNQGATVIHCHAGKDRAGLIAALLLALAKVPAPIIAADYAASEERLWPLYHQLVAAAAGDPARLAQLPPKPSAPPERILATLDHIATRYGDVNAYLLQAGVAPQTLTRLQERLVQPHSE
ncbi:MAG: tyrosine-protein phosphatase [Caldilineaceae bacterium]